MVQVLEMKFATQIRAIDPKTGNLETWRGTDIFADSLEEAQAFVDNNAGYLEIIGHYDESGQVVEIEKAVAAKS